MNLSAFKTLDLTHVMARVQAEHNLDAATTAQAESLYRQFLALHKKHPAAMLVPTRLVDAVWHEHLLDTKKYIADCDTLFGSYLHHHPGKTEDTSPRWQHTKKLYAAEFGIDLDGLNLGDDFARCTKCNT